MRTVAPSAPPRLAEEPTPDEPPQLRERAAGGPEDRALYHCSCGFVFEAAVTAGVDCPHCGGQQAW